MKTETKLTLLRYVLLVGGLFLIFGVAPLMHFWPSGWRWDPPQVKYEQMIIGIYATLGVFLIMASKNPLAHCSLIWFTIWSSLVHATIMLFQALYYPNETGHIYGDVAVLYIFALVLAFLMPRSKPCS